MKEKLLKIAQQFISEKNPDAVLELALSNLGDFTVERFEKDGIKSALLYVTPRRPEKFKILLNTHLDIIPAKPEQFIPKIINNKLYGAGAMDMKANAVCLIMAFKEVAGKVSYPLGLQLVTDEEVGGFNGTKYQIEEGVRANFVIAGEPTNFDIVNQAKGILKLKIFARGTTAHGAYPWKGDNAIWKMNEFLNVLKEKFPNPKQEAWITTINLAKIETTNEAFNKIPDDCLISLDIRYIPEDSDTIVKNIQAILPDGFMMEIVVKESALLTDAENEYVKKLQEVGGKIANKKIILRGANGSSDARHFTAVNCPGIEFGPIGQGIGSDEEWVNIPSLETYYKILCDFLLSLKN